MKRVLISLCIPFLVCVFASNSYADEVTLEYEGGIYKGEVSNGVPHGQGTWTHPDGWKYVGEWNDGQYDGQGTLTSPDGKKYVGEYKDDGPWYGTEYDKDGNVTGTYADGIWKEN